MPTATAVQNLPTIYPALKPLSQAAHGATMASSPAAFSANSNDLQTTFLNLLSEELQNQDPTDPVDSTQMVGQMISLNQLDQLISINQILSQAATDSAAAIASATTAAAGTATARRELTGPPEAASAPSAATAHQLPFDPATMMPWNFSNPSAMAPLPGIPVAGQAGSTFNFNAGGR